MANIDVKIINTSPNPLPNYATKGASGMDIRAFIEKSLPVEPLERVIIPTGLYVEIPDGFEIQVRSRSGLAIKQGIICLNSPGTIDADYRGEIKVILINFSNTVQIIQPGDRIAQMVLQKVDCIQWVLSETVNITDRGEKGFGHTGLQ